LKIENRKSKILGWILPLILAAAVAVVLWLVFRDRIYVVGGDNMLPTLQVGQKVIVERGGTVGRGDIVLVSNPYPQNSAMQKPVFQRCFALPGEKITKLRSGHLYGPAVLPSPGYKINLNYSNFQIYKDLAEQYEGVRMSWRDTVCIVNGKIADTYTFRRGYVFLVNDRRADHSDSRTFGPVPIDAICAKIKFVF
jgi:signal peptidase I